MAPTSPLIQGEHLTYQQDGQSAQVTVGSAEWFRWLETASTFTYHTEHGTFTARLERAGNKRGGTYWRAYRKRAGKLRRAYLGKSVEMTLERLQMVAALLAGQVPAEDTAPDTPSEPGTATLQSIEGPQGNQRSALPTLMTRSNPPQESAHRPSSGHDLPTGTTTLLFTDIEGSTRLLQRVGERYNEVLTACRHLLRAIFQQHHGHEVDTQGDAFFVVFARATDAVAAAVAAQRALVNHSWPEGVAVRVRMGMHTGEPQLLPEGYVGLDVHQAARMMSAGHGGQVLLSQTTRELVEHALPEGASLRDLGEHHLKDLQHPIHLYQVVIAGLAADFPPLKTVESNNQRDPLLATKLHQPRPRSRLVSRFHLVERLQQGMEHALTLVSAPAGFGKTTLLSQWLAESDTPVAWLSLEPEDNDPVRFLTYLIAALQTVDAHLGMTALELLQAPQSPPETLVALLTNDLLHSTAADFILVLDDYHVITAESIHRAMVFLLEHLPPQLHLVLASRADPPLPLARLRAKGQLTEVRASELRLNAAESETFLQEVMGLELPPDAVAALERRAEGWVAGLQLAALSLRGRVDVSAFLAGFTGSHRFVLDYLSEEVLSRQPTPLQSFLLHTSILDRLTGSLCDAVTGQQGSQEMLEALERANLFLVSLDDERCWYRYHGLFADVLLSHLQHTQPALVPELHRRAGNWYRERGLVVEAVHHTLAAPDFESAADLIEGHAQTIAMAGQVQLVLGWLNTLPDSLVRARPFLCINHADLLLHTQQLEAAENRLQDAERCLTPQMLPDMARTIRGCVADIRALIVRQYGDLSRYIALAQQSLDLLRESEELWRTSAEMNAAHVYLLSGNVTAATEHRVRVAVAHSLSSGDIFQILAAGRLLGRLQMLRGHLKEASVTYEKAIQSVQNQEALRVLRGASVYSFGMGDLLREWNRLDDAEVLLTDGMEFLAKELHVPADEVTNGYVTLARLKQGRGEYSQGLATLETFRQFARQHHYVPQLLAHVAAVQAQLELARGDLAAAFGWAEKSGLSPGDAELPYLREREYLTLARVRIAQGRSDPAASSLKEALYLLEYLQEDAESKARMGSVLEMLILRSLALDVRGDQKGALAVFERALVLAEPEGYIRLFVDEGAPMLALLHQAKARGIVPHYVATLLSAFGEPAPSFSALHPSHSAALEEPLTEREREVLELLLEGASNREIAHRLVLSINTVKRHIYNICGKLGVQSRTQAIVKARALNLL